MIGGFMMCQVCSYSVVTLCCLSADLSQNCNAEPKTNFPKGTNKAYIDIDLETSWIGKNAVCECNAGRNYASSKTNLSEKISRI